MRFLALVPLSLICLLPVALAQQHSPVTPGSDVVAVIGGKDITAADFEALVTALPPQMKSAATANRREFLQQYGLLLDLAQEAEKNGLDERTPYRESLAYQRLSILAQAELNESLNRIQVNMDDQRKYYEANRDNYMQAKVKVIYVPFAASATAGDASSGTMTEPQAKEKTGKILAEAQSGADFSELARKHSEDKGSADKGGDFATIRRSDNLPVPIRDAIFALKEGEISQPVRQPNGFYLFRAEEMTPQPFESVQDQIYNDLRQERWKRWLDAKKEGIKIEIHNQDFFEGAAPAGPAGN